MVGTEVELMFKLYSYVSIGDITRYSLEYKMFTGQKIELMIKLFTDVSTGGF